MPNRDVIVIGGSAGALPVLKQLFSRLTPALPAVVLVVVHVPASSRSALPTILERSGRMSVRHAQDGQPLRVGHAFIAPPDRHLIVRDGHLRLTTGPRENGHRPAIDPLFRSAARCYGDRVVGVVISGALDDGCAGMLAIKLGGGWLIAQDPASADYSGIPSAVIEQVGVHDVVQASHLAALLEQRAAEHVPGRKRKETDIEDVPMPEQTDVEQDPELDAHKGEHRAASGFTCPDCHGALWEVAGDDLVRYRCRVGHAFTGASLAAAQDDAVEEAMWGAYRALEESVEMFRRLRTRAQAYGPAAAAERYDERIASALARARVIRRALGLLAEQR